MEAGLVAKDGRVTPYYFTGVLAQIDGLTCLLGVGIDIAERKQAEDELRRETAFMEALVDSALDGVLVVDGQGKKIVQNQRLIKLWKIPPHIAECKEDARAGSICRKTDEESR